MDNKKVTFFGLTSFRNQQKKFGIKQDDRRRHFYAIGKTGMGKSNLMENMAIQDIQNGNGIAYVDPHGEGADKLLDFVPAERIKDVIFLNPADLDFPIAFNVMEKVDFKYRHLVAGGLMGGFKKVWPDVWSARMEYILNNVILALLEYPDSTLLGVNRMLADPEYRAKVVAEVKDPIIRSFWVTEYARYTQRYEIEATAAIQNKVGQFVSNALIRNIIGQTKSTIDMRRIMDEQKILILDLSKGRIGEDNSRLLGALLITKIQLAAMSRVDTPEQERNDFYLYVDEFQNFATESFANILSEARKYRLCLIVGHQYITQMEEEVRDAIFGNVGTMAVFRVGAEDAEFLEKEFSPEFMATDLVNLSKYNIYLKLMIDGVASHPFSAKTLSPPVPLEQSNRDKIIDASRERYGVAREIVEDKIMRWTEGGGDGASQKTETNKRPGVFSAPKSMRSEGRQDHQKNQQGDTEQKLYDAVCSLCNKPTKIIFEPIEGRPVYCKSCLKKIKKAAEEKNNIEYPRVSMGDFQPKKGELSSAPSSKSTVENIPFRLSSNKGSSRAPENSRSPTAPVGGQKGGIQRKEINLSELKKAITDSLAHQSKDVTEEEEADDAPDAPAALPEKQSFAEENPASKSPKSPPAPKEEKNKIINPGGKIGI